MLSASRLALSAKVATRLNKKLRPKVPFGAGQPVGSVIAIPQPKMATVLESGRATLLFDPAFVAKLESRFVSLNQRMKFEVNRHGLLQSKGLPVCQIPEVQPASTERALANCGDAVIGSGQFWANIVLPDQGAYRTQGRLLIFNGRKNGRPVLLAHIFTSHPFNSSFVIVFSIQHISKGPYGTELRASLPQALGSWGYLDRIKLTLRRKYTYRGKQLSYFNAGCPAAKGAKRAAFPLAYAEFFFAGRKPLGATVNKTCGVAE